MTDRELDELLTHHFVLHPEQQERSSQIKEAAILFAQVVLDNTTPGAEQDMVLSAIKHAMTASGLALAFEGLR